MKAIQIEQAGGSEQLKYTDLAMPVCGPDDVLVEIKAVGINYIDIYTRTGLYKPAGYPFVPGKEGSGIVAAVGSNVQDVQLGERVAFCAARTGSYAEFALVPAQQITPIPDKISFEMAAAAMLQGLTSYYLSHLTFPLNQQHTALIHAGAGGVGLLLIQMAKLLKAQVITTVSTLEKAEQAQAAGADKIVIYTEHSFYDAVMQYTQQKGVDVVYDAVGKTTFTDSLKSLAIRGMLVSYGQASGVVPPFEISRLAEKSLYITRPVLGSYTGTKPELLALSSALFKLILNNQLKITIGQRYQLADAISAHNDLEGRKTIGKSILIP